MSDVYNKYKENEPRLSEKNRHWPKHEHKEVYIVWEHFYEVPRVESQNQGTGGGGVCNVLLAGNSPEISEKVVALDLDDV